MVGHMLVGNAAFGVPSRELHITWVLRALTSVVVKTVGLGAPRVSVRAACTVGACRARVRLLCPHLLPGWRPEAHRGAVLPGPGGRVGSGAWPAFRSFRGRHSEALRVGVL